MLRFERFTESQVDVDRGVGTSSIGTIQCFRQKGYHFSVNRYGAATLSASELREIADAIERIEKGGNP